MDWLNDARIVTTLFGFICFVAICIWAYSKRSQSGFDEAAMIPFREDDQHDAGQHTH